jgi:integrase
VKFVSDSSKFLARHVELDDADSVNLFIARKQCFASYMDSLVKAYKYYADFCEISHVKPKFRCERKLPRIPTREAIMNVVSASSKKYATIFRILMETGVMPFELANVSFRGFDFERGCLFLNSFARWFMLMVLLRLWMACDLGYDTRGFRRGNRTRPHLKNGI